MRLKYPAFLYKRSGDSVTLEPNRAGYNSSLMDANVVSVKPGNAGRGKEVGCGRSARSESVGAKGIFSPIQVWC